MTIEQRDPTKFDPSLFRKEFRENVAVLSEDAIADYHDKVERGEIILDPPVTLTPESETETFAGYTKPGDMFQDTYGVWYVSVRSDSLWLDEGESYRDGGHETIARKATQGEIDAKFQAEADAQAAHAATFATLPAGSKIKTACRAAELEFVRYEAPLVYFLLRNGKEIGEHVSGCAVVSVAPVTPVVEQPKDESCSSSAVCDSVQKSLQEDTMKIDQATIEAFMEACGDTNFQIVATGQGDEGAVTPTLQKETFWLSGESKSKMGRWYNGLRTGATVSGQTRVFLQAAALAENDDWLGAIVLFIECGYFAQVALRPLAYVQGPDGASRSNPLAASLEPLVWRCERGHGGARPGAGRPALGGKLVPVDMPVEMIDALATEAQQRGITRAELIRTLIQEGLKQ